MMYPFPNDEKTPEEGLAFILQPGFQHNNFFARLPGGFHRDEEPAAEEQSLFNDIDAALEEAGLSPDNVRALLEEYYHGLPRITPALRTPERVIIDTHGTEVVATKAHLDAIKERTSRLRNQFNEIFMTIAPALLRKGYKVRELNC